MGNTWVTHLILIGDIHNCQEVTVSLGDMGSNPTSDTNYLWQLDSVVVRVHTFEAGVTSSNSAQYPVRY